MGGQDKLAAEIGGLPMLAWTLRALTSGPTIERVVVVTAAEHIAGLRAAAWLPDKVVAIVAGGGRRQESVAAGLAALDALDDPGDPSVADRVVLVHDGARPLVTETLIRSVAAAAAQHGAAIPVTPITETMKRTESGIVAGTVDRDTFVVAQTPQGARRGILRDAFAAQPADGPSVWTDEAALLEACRIPVHAIRGDPANIKVTVPADIDRVRLALAPTRPMRPGLGRDSHSFGPGNPLMLGAVEIAGAPRLHGHSDGDVALHAVCDALLGAAGLGDLGRLFPAGPATPAGISSVEIAREVVGRLAAAGWRAASLDLTIVASRPRLAPHLDAMADAIAALLDVPSASVNVKASTGNLDGMEGAGRGISAEAIVALEPL